MLTAPLVRSSAATFRLVAALTVQVSMTRSISQFPSRQHWGWLPSR
jgi:hypothetical protein